MPNDNAMLESHEQRLQTVERLSVDFAAHTKSEEYRFQMISDQISTLGKQVTDSIAQLGERVEGLATQTSEHHEYLRSLNEEKSAREKRRAIVKRVVWGIGAAAGIALLEAWGVDTWKWLREAVNHLKN